MSKEQDDIELIENYILNRLDEEQHTLCQARIKEDANFSKLFDELNLVVNGVKVNSINDTIDRLNQLDEKSPIKEKIKVVPLGRHKTVLGIAASLLILVSTFVIWQNHKNPAQVLYKQHYQPYPNQISPSVRGAKLPESIKERAYYAYDLGKYDRAILLFAKIPKDEDDGSSLFYMAIAHMSTGNHEKAEVLLTQYLEGHNTFQEQAHWYLALNHLEIDPVKAIELFESIPESSSYHQKAVLVLNSLKKNAN